MNGRATAACVCAAVLLACGSAHAGRPEFAFKAPARVESAATAATMRDLAERVLPVYQDADQTRFLDNLLVLQLVAGDDRAALETHRTLKERQAQAHAPHTRPAVIDPAALFEAWATARAATLDGKHDFDAEFTRRLSATLRPLGDLAAFELTHWNGTLPASYAADLQAAFAAVRATPKITTAQALRLLRLYLRYRVYEQTHAAVAELAHREHRRRYTAQALRIRTPDGAALHARLLQPRVPARRPVVLEFTLDRGARPSPECAAHGYACVVAWTRDAFIRSGRIRPFWTVPRDAAAVVAWVARQPWSDGRVGMVGAGYSAFAAWAATRHVPKALAAIATTDALVPGIDFPTQGRIFQNAALRWATNYTHGTAQHGEHRDDFWRALDARWYAEGAPYDTLDKLAKLPNGVFQRWLGHPSFDAHWSVMTPDAKTFAALDIPILIVTGTHAANAAGDLYLFRAHARQRPSNRDVLLVGPWDDHALRHGPRPTLDGLPIDPAAQVNLSALRFAWLDHILKGAPRPTLLKAAVNVEVAGTNAWRHGPSLVALAPEMRRYHLAATPHAQASDGRLTPGDSRPGLVATLAVDFKARGDADDTPPTPAVVTRELALRNALAFRSAPLEHATVIIGRYTGHLVFRVNKLDMDFTTALYAQLPDGTYHLLAHRQQQRASYVRDPTNRRLLRPGSRQTLDFASPYVAAAALPAGSRLVFVLGINKRPDAEINYGAGNDVAVESIKDAGAPLEVQWYGDSSVTLPLAPSRRAPRARNETPLNTP